MKEDKDEDKNDRNWIAAAILGALTIWIVNWLWPGVIPIPTFALWNSNNESGVLDWLAAGLPIFVWGFVLRTVYEFRESSRSPWERMMRGFLSRTLGLELTPGQMFTSGLFLSAWAGFAEEIAFRWLIFLSAIVWVKVTNFLFLGFVGLNIVAWIHNNIVGALADWMSFSYLHDVIYHSSGWAVGAAMLSANAFFRDGHKYQGPIGYINSWFVGLFLFWIAFHYGLWASIVIHFTYDVIIFTTAAIGLAARR